MIGDVIRVIEEHSQFVLTSHARPDGDAVGSVLACGAVLRQLGKRADVVLADGIPFLYRPLPFASEVMQHDAIRKSYEAAIVLECDSTQRTRLRGLDNLLLVNIDHHISGKPFGNVNWIDPSACATAEMIFRLARETGAKLTPQIATCLYTGLLTDTGSFCFANTSARTFSL